MPTETSCPGCGAAVRNADGSIGRTQIALMMGLGAVFSVAGIACGDSEGSGGGGGGGNGGGTTTSATATSATKSTSQATTTMAVSTYGTGPSTSGPCDDGNLGSLESQLCEDCISCAWNSSTCSDEISALQADPDAQAFFECIDACADAACEDACTASYPSPAALYADFLSCAICVECPNNCDFATNCQ